MHASMSIALLGGGLVGTTGPTNSAANAPEQTYGSLSGIARTRKVVLPALGLCTLLPPYVATMLGKVLVAGTKLTEQLDTLAEFGVACSVHVFPALKIPP